MQDIDSFKKNELKPAAPSYCCFCITLRCLMRCKSCYIWNQKVDFDKEISVESWIAAVKSLPGFLDKKTDIIISGGEPLLKENILDLITFCSENDIKISLQTNASLINKELVKKLADAGLWRICITLYSLREEIHDCLRGKKGVYRKVLEAIDLLSKFAPDVGINIQNIIMDINLEDIIRMADWVEKDERIDYVYFLSPMMPFGVSEDKDWFSKNDYRFMWPQDPVRVSSILDELIDKKEYFRKIANPVSQLNIFKRYFNHSLAYTDTRCTLGVRGINVDPEGNAFLCFSQTSIGNIQDGNLEDIWVSDRAQEVRQQMQHCNRKCNFLINCSFEYEDLVDHTG